MALPSFTDSGGPMPGTGGQGRIVGPQPETPAGRVALAALYTALMCAQAIDAIGSANDIVVDGALSRNRLFCQVLSAMRADQQVVVSPEGDGTALGAARLAAWASTDTPTPKVLDRIRTAEIAGLRAYGAEWAARSSLVRPQP